MKRKDGRWSELQGNSPISRLKKVISDLKEEEDIEGAILVKGKDRVVACELPKRNNHTEEIAKILALVEEWNASALSGHYDDMFTQCVFDYNGYKILAKKLNKNLALLVMLQKKGYIGPTMLDIENSAREILRILAEREVWS